MAPDGRVLDIRGAVAEEQQGLGGLAERVVGGERALPLEQHLRGAHRRVLREQPARRCASRPVRVPVGEPGEPDVAERRVRLRDVVEIHPRPDLIEGPAASREVHLHLVMAQQSERRRQHVTSKRDSQLPAFRLGFSGGQLAATRGIEDGDEQIAEAVEQLGLDGGEVMGHVGSGAVGQGLGGPVVGLAGVEQPVPTAPPSTRRSGPSATTHRAPQPFT